MSFASLARLAIPLARAAGNWARWIRLVSSTLDTIIIGALPGVVYEVRYEIGLVSENSTHVFPPGAVVSSAELNVTVPYSGGTTITLGTPGLPLLFMSSTDNTPTVANLYQVSQDTDASSQAGSPIRATVAGGPVAGAAFVIIRYSVPFS